MATPGFRLLAGTAALTAVVLAGAYAVTSGADRAETQTRTVQLVASEFRFSPSEITLRAGVPTRLTFINEGKLEHDVVLEGLVSQPDDHGVPDSHGTQDVHGSGLAAHQLAGHTDAVHATAPSGQSAEVEFVAPPGTYRLICTITGHDAAGMTGVLRVS